MAHYGNLKGRAVSDAAEDIRGSHLYGIDDEKLGTIDDVIFNHSSGDIQFVVVDAGGWLHTKKFIVPADRLRNSATHQGDFETSLTKVEVEGFPPYDESDLDSESKWSGYEGSYRSKWVSDPVMHRVETDRNITPTTYQMVGNQESEQAEAKAQGLPADIRTGRVHPISTTGLRPARAEADVAAAESVTERAIPAGTDTVVISNSANGIGGRWDTFQSRLRERRKEAVASCQTCTGESAVKRGTESTETLRKAV